MKKLMFVRTNHKGFTLVEILIIVIVLAILATIGYSTVTRRYREKTYYTRAIAELNSMANATSLYVAKYNEYPEDENRNVPAGLKEFVQGQEGIDEWPSAPFPGSVYDYDYWPADENGPQDTYQVSIRFCDVGDTATCQTNAQKYLSEYLSQTTLDNWDSQSSMYYCIKGSCRSHQSQPIDHPGYCINCEENQ